LPLRLGFTYTQLKPFAAKLFAPFFIIGAPYGIRPLWVMASTSPVPFTAIAKQYLHTQHLLDADFSFVE
jgi:hypothetical protein